MRAAALVAASAVALLAAACGAGEQCSAPGVTCAGPATYDLVVTEADSGKVGISTGPHIAFLLNGSRDNLTTSPRLAVSTISDPQGQFPGQHAFAIHTSVEGIYDVTATGKQSVPFRFHLIVGTSPSDLQVVRPGGLVIQESGAGATALAPLVMPTFELIQDSVATGNRGTLLTRLPSPTRRVYRARVLGAQSVKSYGVTPQRVVVADPPSSLDFNFVDAATAFEYPGNALPYGVGSRIAIVFMGDRVRVSWTAVPSDALMRLPDADIGPQPPGATLIPFRIMTEGPAKLELQTSSNTMIVLIEDAGATCLPDDFPRYPLAQTVSLVTRPCQVDMMSADSPSQIVAFYRTRLSKGDWRVVSVKGSSITFSRRSNPAIGGTLDAKTGSGIHVEMH